MAIQKIDFTEVFKDLHQNPELSFQETHTTQYIHDCLSQWGITILPHGLKTGLVAQIQGNKQGPIICLRCDIDALPLAEETDLAYCSKTGAMHACGHDMHTAIMLNVAYLLKQQEDSINGTIKLLFQPAEESSHGAEDVVASGILNDVQAIFGLHVDPEHATGSFGFCTGAVTASVDRFEIYVQGTGCHAARPHEGIDPIVISAQIITALQTIVSRNTHPFDPAVVSVTHITSGSTWNIIPMEAKLEGTVRTLNAQTRKDIPKKMTELSENIAHAFGGNAQFIWYPGPPATNNDPNWTNIAETLAKENNLTLFESSPSMGGEDFAFYQETIPGVFFQVGVNSPYPLHHPKFQADPAAIEPAATYFVDLAKTALQILKEGR